MKNRRTFIAICAANLKGGGMEIFMDVNYAYLEQEWKYSIFCFGKIKIRFLQDGTIQYRKVLSWKNGGVMVEVQTKYGDRKEYINIAGLLSDLGYNGSTSIPAVRPSIIFRNI